MKTKDQTHTAKTKNHKTNTAHGGKCTPFWGYPCRRFGACEPPKKGALPWQYII
jgi:hypothetical protein